MTETIEKVATIICDILDEDGISITRDSTADMFEDWDSLAQLQILDAIEKEFSIKFSIAEMESLAVAGTVGGAIDLIDKKQSLSRNN